MNYKTEFLLVAMLLLSGNALAFDWLLDPGMTLTQRYTDNLRLLTTRTKGNYITTISPSLSLGYLADNNELTVKLNWNQLVYDNESDLNFSEKIASFNHLATYQKWSTQLQGRYGVESSLASQLGTSGSGNLLQQVPRYSRTLTPQITYQLTEKDSLSLSGNYFDVTFGSVPFGVGLGFSDYVSEQISLTATHKYSERLSLNVTPGYNIYTASNNSAGYVSLLNGSLEPGVTGFNQRSTTESFQLGFKYQYDEKTTLTGSGGIRDSKTHSLETVTINCAALGILNTPLCPNSASPTNSTTSGKIYSAMVNRVFDHGNLSLSYNQQLTPASTGSQQQTTQYQAALSYDFDERWNAGFNGSYFQSDYVAGYLGSATSINNGNRTVISMSPTLRWRWTPDSYFQFSYTYINQDLFVLNQIGTQNSVQLQFNYQPQINRQVK